MEGRQWSGSYRRRRPSVTAMLQQIRMEMGATRTSPYGFLGRFVMMKLV